MPSAYDARLTLDNGSTGQMGHQMPLIYGAVTFYRWERFPLKYADTPRPLYSPYPLPLLIRLWALASDCFCGAFKREHGEEPLFP